MGGRRQASIETQCYQKGVGRIIQFLTFLVLLESIVDVFASAGVFPYLQVNVKLGRATTKRKHRPGVGSDKRLGRNCFFYHILSSGLTFLDSINFEINEMAVVLTWIGTFHFYFLFCVKRE